MRASASGNADDTGDGLSAPATGCAPLTKQALRALLDQGMSNAEIAGHLGIEARHVALLREVYHL